MTQPIHTAILGASGYTGAELLRLLHNHPAFKIMALTGDSQAGKPIEAVYPHLRGRNLPALVKHTEVDFSNIQLVFCCLPHGTTQEIIASLPTHIRIVDLSADFRLHDAASYEEWYGHPHRALDLQKEAVYGLTEFNRERIKTARLVANPGCYPTCSLLALLPLMARGIISPEGIIINALSGISGAGRSAKQEYLFTELDGGVSAYSIGRHRHVAEIEQELSAKYQPLESDSTARKFMKMISPEKRYQAACPINFTPHLVPMTRGMLATIHTQESMREVMPLNEVHAYLNAYYKNEPFVKIMPLGTNASTHQVRGTNQCFISVHYARAGYLTLVSVIDNLVKGASGQALQNANLMFGLPETTNLELTAVFP